MWRLPKLILGVFLCGYSPIEYHVLLFMQNIHKKTFIYTSHHTTRKEYPSIFGKNNNTFKHNLTTCILNTWKDIQLCMCFVLNMFQTEKNYLFGRQIVITYILLFLVRCKQYHNWDVGFFVWIVNILFGLKVQKSRFL